MTEWYWLWKAEVLEEKPIHVPLRPQRIAKGTE
jgi:hypothetical protein